MSTNTPTSELEAVNRFIKENPFLERLRPDLVSFLEAVEAGQEKRASDVSRKALEKTDSGRDREALREFIIKVRS